MGYSKYVQKGTVQRVCNVPFDVVCVAWYVQVMSFKMWGGEHGCVDKSEKKQKMYTLVMYTFLASFRNLPHPLPDMPKHTPHPHPVLPLLIYVLQV